MNDEHELIELACYACDGKVRGTYKKLFGNLPSLMVMPAMKCKCGGVITIKMTGEYLQEAQDEQST